MNSSRKNWIESHPDLIIPTVLATITLILCLYINVHYLEQIPHVQDSVNNLFQARLFTQGKLYVKTPDFPDFFVPELLVYKHGRMNAHYPFVFPSLMALGVLFGAPWAVNPFIGAVSIFWLYYFGRRFYNWRVGLAGAILLISSPFFQCLTASMMSHATGLLLSLGGAYFALKALTHFRYRDTFFSAVFFGLLFNTRPLTAVAFVLVTSLFYLGHLRVSGFSFWKHFLVFSIVIILFTGLFFYYNFLLSGKMMKFVSPVPAFDQLPAGKSAAPHSGILNRFVKSLREIGVFGAHYSFATGLSNVKVLLGLFQVTALNWPKWLNFAWFLIPFSFLNRRKTDYYLLALFFSVPAAYVIYARSAIMYGPRYLYEIMPFFILLTVRGLEQTVVFAGSVNAWLPGIRKCPRIIPEILLPAVLYCGMGYLVYGNVHQFWIEQRLPAGRSTTFGMVQRIRSLKGFNGVKAYVPTFLEQNGVHNALVFIRCTKWWGYGSVALENGIHFDTDIVYARDRGLNNDLKVIRAYPERNYYLVDYQRKKLFRIIPVGASGEPELEEIAVYKPRK